MNPAARNICRSIEGVSKALAEWTVSAQFDADPTLAHRYGEGSRRRWVADTQSRLTHLAQALAVRSPDLFIESVLWMRDAFVARGSHQADLALNVKCLRDVMAAEMPTTVTEVALPCIERALAAMTATLNVAESGDGASAGDAPVSTLSKLSLDFLEMTLAGRGEDAQQRVLAAAEAGDSVRDLYLHVLWPAMREVGRRWQLDEISVADEHHATNVTQMLMSRLRPHFPDSAKRARRVIAAASSGDLHELGVRMVADFFVMDGWDVIYLGANMPAVDLINAIIERDAHLVALSASSVVHLAALGETIEAIRAAPGCERVRVLVGGPPFNSVPTLWKEIAADGSAGSADHAVEMGNRLVEGDAVGV